MNTFNLASLIISILVLFCSPFSLYLSHTQSNNNITENRIHIGVHHTKLHLFKACLYTALTHTIATTQTDNKQNIHLYQTRIHPIQPVGYRV